MRRVGPFSGQPSSRLRFGGFERCGDLPRLASESAITLTPMTFLLAAEAVLKAARRPMTVGEITELAMKRGLIKSKGKTPVMTMSATLYMMVKADPNGPIQRDYVPAQKRAARNSVRWRWDGR